ncbi:MAG TPA: hypothetical protein PLE52_00990 [Paludibacteraceae bacterium]|nr:hypothetical protein [Paludibacteraceae bacterium]
MKQRKFSLSFFIIFSNSRLKQPIWKFVLKKYTTTEILKVNISYPIRWQTFISQIVQVFSSMQPTILRIGALGVPLSE